MCIRDSLWGDLRLSRIKTIWWKHAKDDENVGLFLSVPTNEQINSKCHLLERVQRILPTNSIDQPVTFSSTINQVITLVTARKRSIILTQSKHGETYSRRNTTGFLSKRRLQRNTITSIEFTRLSNNAIV